MNITKRIIAFFLAALMLVCLVSCGKGSKEPAVETTTDSVVNTTKRFRDGAADIACAVTVTMRYLQDITALDSASAMWETIGWYSALTKKPVLNESEVSALQYILRPGTLPMSLPEGWAQEGKVKAERTWSGLNYDFSGYAAEFNEFFGALIFTPHVDENKLIVDIEVYDSESEFKETYSYYFAADVNAGEAFPYVLENAELPDEGTPESGWGIKEFSFDDLVKANSVTKLIADYGTVKYVYNYFDGDSVTYFFNKNGLPCRANYNLLHNGDAIYSGLYFNTYVENQDDSLVCYESVDTYNGSDSSEYQNDEMISVFFDYNDAGELREEGDNYVFTTHGIYDTTETTYTVNKETLVIQEIFRECEGMTETQRFTYGEAADDFGLFDGWDRSLREVRFNCEFHEDGEEVLSSYKFEVPDNVEIRLGFYAEANYYLDEDLTVPYEYPGDGEGYIVYVTDAMG